MIVESSCTVRLGDVASSRYGYTAKCHKDKIGVAYLRITDIKLDGTLRNERVYVSIKDNDLEKYLLKPGDIVIARSGATAGKSFLFSGEETLVFASYLIRFRPNQQVILPSFLYYVLNSNSYWIYVNGKRTIGAQPNINAKILGDFLFVMPPILTQEKIIKKLDAILPIFERNRTIILNRTRSKIFKLQLLLESLSDHLITHYYGSPGVIRNAKFMKLSDVCIINPSKRELVGLDERTEVSFVPMRLVDEERGMIRTVEVRKLADVKKGFTYFRNNDVIFAKITPCMENGKSSLCINLKNDIGFGSTEFIVLRVTQLTIPEWIYYFIRQKKFRHEAALSFKGTAGHQRVPESFLRSYVIPIPPLQIQMTTIKLLKDALRKANLIRSEICAIIEYEGKLVRELTKVYYKILDNALTCRIYGIQTPK